MNIVLTTLNSKYIHSALSLRYLKSFSSEISDMDIAEFTINQNADYIAGEIFKMSPDIVAFSVYIWNVKQILKICRIIKIVDSHIKIILGGPEISFEKENILDDIPYVDFIISGEGEETFKELLLALTEKKEDFDLIKGLTFRKENRSFKNQGRDLIKNLDIIPSPFLNIKKDELKDKIVYFESSRGCPFNCKFCLSSTIKGVRFFTIDRVKDDLKRLIKAEVRQVKFVDRTFNADKEYAMEIMNFIMKMNPQNMNFHFEVTAHLLDEDMLEFLSHVKDGLFQFEIGVQSTNEKTLETIGRKTDIKKLKRVTKRIKSYRSIHQHLDLIAGLPFEDYDSFKNSFNEVYELRPEKLQLGFLKLLKGSKLREDKELYGFKFLNEPPYEVLETDSIKYKDMLKLKTIEDLVEKYGNDSSFENTLEYVIKNYYNTPFDFYEDYADYWEQKDYHKISHSKRELYRIIYEFYKERISDNIEIFNEILKYDYIFYNKSSNLPEYIKRATGVGNINKKHDILKDEEILNNYLHDYSDMPTKRILNIVHMETFPFDIISFIEEGYKRREIKKDKKDLMFVYENGVMNKCKVFDITKIANKYEE